MLVIARGGGGGGGLYEYNIIAELIFYEQLNPFSLNQHRMCVPMQALIDYAFFEGGTANVTYYRRGGGVWV